MINWEEKIWVQDYEICKLQDFEFKNFTPNWVFKGSKQDNSKFELHIWTNSKSDRKFTIWGWNNRQTTVNTLGRRQMIIM